MSKTKSKKVNPFYIQNPIKESDYIPYLLNIANTSCSAFAKQLVSDIKEGKLPNLAVNPSDYDCPYAYLEDAQTAAYFSKNPLYNVEGIDKEEAAMRAFLDAEDQCRLTNNSIRSGLKGDRSSPFWQVLYTARHYVDQILGEFSFGDLRFGPGSTMQLKGKHANFISKLGTLPEVTPHAHDLVLKTVLDKIPHYAISCGIVERERGSVYLKHRHLPIVQYDELCFVEKNYKTLRSICIGPMGNMILQLGVGAKIRSKLKKYGLDLDRTPERHAIYAKNASIDGSLATIDLKSASDTVSYELVKFLLPPEWFDVLSALRCRKTKLPNGTIILNEKFSAMGNGFTFELESLIFYVLQLAVRKLYGNRSDIVSTFGDDIICSTSLARPLIAVLNLAGFTTNIEKTFVDGPFRESCGNDYFRGINVRPLYFKDCFDGRKPIETLFYLVNRIGQIAYRDCSGYCYSPRYSKFRKNLLKRLRNHVQWYGNPSYGDTCIHEGVRKGKGYYLVRRSAKTRIPLNPDWALACALAGVDSSGVSARRARYHLKRKRIKTDSESVLSLTHETDNFKIKMYGLQNHTKVYVSKTST